MSTSCSNNPVKTAVDNVQHLSPVRECTWYFVHNFTLCELRIGCLLLLLRDPEWCPDLLNWGRKYWGWGSPCVALHGSSFLATVTCWEQSPGGLSPGPRKGVEGPSRSRGKSLPHLSFPDCRERPFGSLVATPWGPSALSQRPQEDICTTLPATNVSPILPGASEAACQCCQESL